MKTKLNLGSTPIFENSIEVGSPNYEILVKKDCNRFIDLLRFMFGKEPDGAELIIDKKIHDCDTTYEVCCQYDPSNDAATNYALRLESNGPTTWNGN